MPEFTFANMVAFLQSPQAAALQHDLSLTDAPGDYGQDHNADKPEGCAALIDYGNAIILRVYNTGKVELLPL